VLQSAGSGDEMRNLKRNRALRLNEWYSTWDKRTPGGMRRHLREYVKLKIKYIIS
jgi:hypothetical protein